MIYYELSISDCSLPKLQQLPPNPSQGLDPLVGRGWAVYLLITDVNMWKYPNHIQHPIKYKYANSEGQVRKSSPEAEKEFKRVDLCNR